MLFATSPEACETIDVMRTHRLRLLLWLACLGLLATACGAAGAKASSARAEKSPRQHNSPFTHHEHLGPDHGPNIGATLGKYAAGHDVHNTADGDFHGRLGRSERHVERQPFHGHRRHSSGVLREGR